VGLDIGAWLRDLGLERYEQAFQDTEVEARSLPHLTADDLKKMGVTAIGHRRLLLQAIAELQESGTAAVEPVSERISSSEGVGDTPKRASEAERRQLTVMFVDLVGSTELSARLCAATGSMPVRCAQNFGRAASWNSNPFARSYRGATY
jgi:class 3 adenylate cyclase